MPLLKKLKLPRFALSRAVQLLKSPEELRGVLEDARVKMATVGGARSLKSVIDVLRTMLRLVRAWVKGTHTEVSKANLACIVGAVVYFLVPFDFIPDILGPGGYADDAAVIVWVISLVEEELVRFKAWETRHGAQGLVVGAFPISRSRAHTHRRHGHPLQTVPSAGLIERPQEKNRVDALR